MDKLRLTSNELGVLWTQYVQNSMVDQVLKYLLETVENEQIKSIVEETLTIL
ncbi:DUF3231 family protein [Halobacillus shinanisalinarum]|uniref:DUF3231 family protein n=1 Tax=Halobacillus shinanisalinarum TaxID=2932258 RepID=UPI002104573D|nr:DUF3231 family protein [Halobacillus shinanisalinarum]